MTPDPNARSQISMPSKDKLNPALKPFWCQRGIRNRILYGGRDSTKTWDAAGMAIFFASEFSIRVLATREFQNRISDSVFTVLVATIERFGWQAEFDIGASTIKHRTTGSEFIFYGRARNINEIKGLEGIDIHWSEESELLTDEEWQIIDATLRKEGSQHWIIFNPRFQDDFVYQRFVVNPPADTLVRRINYDENPWLSETSRKRIEAMRLDDPQAHEHYYLGVPWENSEGSVIMRSWIEAAIDAHLVLGIEPTGKRRIGFDVADDGADKCANVYAHGFLLDWCEEWEGLEDKLLQSCSRTYANARARDAEIVYDSIGVGAGCGAKFDELNAAQSGPPVRHAKFNAGSSVMSPDAIYTGNVKNKDQFANLKAQAWWLVADRFRNTYNAIKNGQKFRDDELISISSKMPMLEKLKTELSTPKREFDPNGRVRVESKKDLAKRGIKSPNISDATVMLFAPERPRGFFG